MYADYRVKNDFIGMDMCRKFLEMGFTRARRYANHKDGKKYNNDGTIKYKKKIGQQVIKQSRQLYLKDIEISLQKTLNIKQCENIGVNLKIL